MEKFKDLRTTGEFYMGKYTVKIVIRDEIDPQVWEKFMAYFLKEHRKVCRGYTFRQYYEHYKAKVNVAIFIIEGRELRAFSLCGLDGVNGTIWVTCGLEGPLKFGLMARYLAMKVMFNNGVKYVYNDAAHKPLIKYYAKLGFLLGKKRCEFKDKITENHIKKLQQGLDYVPRNYLESGYRMKFCGGDLSAIESYLIPVIPNYYL